MATKLHKEKQRYHDWFVMVALALAILSLLYASASYFWHPKSTTLYSVVCLILAGGLAYVLWWLNSLQYKLTVTDEKVKFKLKGMMGSSRSIAWEDIVSCQLVKTTGPGKWSRPKLNLTDERYYSLDGRNGLLIETVKGVTYFIGSQDVEGLRTALSEGTDIWEVDVEDFEEQE